MGLAVVLPSFSASILGAGGLVATAPSFTVEINCAISGTMAVEFPSLRDSVGMYGAGILNVESPMFTADMGGDYAIHGDIDINFQDQYRFKFSGYTGGSIRAKMPSPFTTSIGGSPNIDDGVMAAVAPRLTADLSSAIPPSLVGSASFSMQSLRYSIAMSGPMPGTSSLVASLQPFTVTITGSPDVLGGVLNAHTHRLFTADFGYNADFGGDLSIEMPSLSNSVDIGAVDYTSPSGELRYVRP